MLPNLSITDSDSVNGIFKLQNMVFCCLVICCIGCNDKEVESAIRGHLIEGTTGESLSNVKVTLYDDAKIYAIVISDENGMFSMATPPLKKDYYYSLSFYWSTEYPAKVVTINNIPKVFDLHDFIVYDKSNPYDYKIWEGYMIHNTLPGEYTFFEAKEACNALRDGYDDWTLPEADYLDVLADNEELAKQITELGWYWSSWIFGGDTYMGVNVWNNATTYTMDPYEKLKVLPVRLIKNVSRQL